MKALTTATMALTSRESEGDDVGVDVDVDVGGRNCG